MIILKYIFTSALLVAAASASQAFSRQQMQKQTDKDAPAYTIQGKDSICQIFIYSPAPNQGLHLAYFTDDERWVDVGQLCASDYGPWGAEKKMYNPFVVKANDGTWRALWSVNQHAPQFAVAYSEDLITWRPQDYPIIREKGVKDVAAYQMDDGNFDIYLKTSKGKRYVQASNDFRTFKEDTLEASADEILWQRDTATIGGKLFQGCDFEVPAVHLNYIRSWFHALSEEAKLNAQPIPKTDSDLAAYAKDNHIDLPIDSEIPANLSINPQKSHRISNKLMGIFFEDISRAADGGLSAEMLQNGDFEYNKEDHRHQWNATTAWVGVEKESIATENGVSQNNAHYAVLGATPIYNIGWDGIAIRRGAAVEGKEGKHQPAIYEVSLHARCIDAKKKDLTLALVNQEGLPVCQTKIKVQGADWKEYKAQLIVTDKYEGELASEATTKEGKLGKNIRFAILPKGEQKVAVDLVSLKPQDTYKGHGLRKDLAEAIADLKPRFVRFPGGCMLHGQGIKNIYHWKESVGPQKDRKPAYNIWGYHQTRQLGFYEYFQWCEDMGAEPLPVLAAGVPCQNSVADERGVAGQQGGIPMSEMPQYIQDVLDLVEWANGDPATSKWAKMRAEVVGTVGPFHFPSSDYIEGWKIARENKRWIDAVDEHYYEQPGWFLNHQDYYDHYDRKAPKVYLGEYASRGANAVDNALAEGIYLCNVERNGDVVEMTSYAPLLCKDGYSNWQPDMIYFDNNNVRASESYKMQKMFGQHAGDLYISSVLSLPDALKKYVGTSVVKDSKSGKTWLKVVNALPRTLKLSVSGLGNKQVTITGRSAQVFEL